MRRGLTDQQFKDQMDESDPHHQLDLSMRLLAAMENVYTKYIDSGDLEGAQKVSALLAMKAIDMSSRYGAEAAEFFRNGQWKTGIEALDNAQAMVPKDTKFTIEKINDNGTGIASERDLSGKVIKTFNVTPELLVNAANGLSNGSWGGRGMKLLQ